MPKKAVVVGALGVIGRYIVGKLVDEGDSTCTGNAAGHASAITPNRDMLVNSVTAIVHASRALQRVVLATDYQHGKK